MESATSMARSSPPVPLPPSEFHYFIEFPPEIRLKIWRLTMPPLRCIRICYSPEPTPRDWKLKEKLLPPREKSCTRRVPVILQVCNESREEGLRVYQLSLAALFPDHTIYFNDGTNIIYLEKDGVVDALVLSGYLLGGTARDIRI